MKLEEFEVTLSHKSSIFKRRTKFSENFSEKSAKKLFGNEAITFVSQKGKNFGQISN